MEVGTVRQPHALTVPSVHNTAVTLVNRGFSGFDGLDHFDQRFAGYGRIHQHAVQPRAA